MRHPPERIHTTRLKTRLLAHIEGLMEFKEGKESYLAFDEDLGGVLKEIYEKNYDDDAFVLSKAAEILRRDVFAKENKPFDGTFDLDTQNESTPQCLQSFVDMLLQGPNVNNEKKKQEQSRLTISQLISQNMIKRGRKDAHLLITCLH